MRVLRLSLPPLALCLSLAACLPSCSSIGQRAALPRITVMSYNVDNLFDASDGGLEYPEFRVSSGKWDDARYRSRLERLAEVLRAAAPDTRGPDVACLVEVENLRVLEDLRRGQLSSSGYTRSVLVPAPGQAVNCGILARLPFLGLRAHGIDSEGRHGRYVLEAAFDAGGQRLTVFLCHWKSKLGGAEVTEPDRACAAALVAGRVAEILAADPAAEFLVCGDFNEEPDEFAKAGGAYRTALMPAGPRAAGAAPSVPCGATAVGGCIFVTGVAAEAGTPSEDGPVLYSPWPGSEGWSYMMDGRPERIDGFLLPPGLLDGEGLSFESFRPLDADFLLGASGAPLPYNVRTGAGYSDHLPIVLTLSLAAASP